MRKNSKGVVMSALAIAISCWWGGAILMVTSAVLLRPKFIVRKSVEKCISEGGNTKDCTNLVHDWDQKTRLSYIKDNAPADPNQNYKQNFHG